MTASFTSSAYYINDLMSGSSWTGTTGSPGTISYTYAIAVVSASEDASNGLEKAAILNPAQQTAMQQAIQAWENVCNVHFVNTNAHSASQVDVTIREAVMSGNTAGWFVPDTNGTKLLDGDLVVDSVSNPTAAVGSYSYQVFMHELGHALGLKHPGNYSADDTSPYLPASEDTNDFTIMSYNDGVYSNINNNATTPMIYDIAAAQFLYGANTSYNAGNTLYSFDGSLKAMTIWDGGGIDTIDTTSSIGNATIDLREGINNITIVGKTDVWIAFGANIENATAGAGNDLIHGNALGNTITANAGNDTVLAHQGNDIVYGNQGNDTLSGGLGDDSIYGGQGNDSITGNEGNNVIYGNQGNDVVTCGGNSTDQIVVSSDTVYGGLGDDTIFGNAGPALIYGNQGNDTLVSGSGNDSFAFHSGDGVDEIVGYHGGDKIDIPSAVFTTAAQAYAAVVYTNVGAVINLGNGTSVTIIGVTAHSLTAHDFQVIA